MAKRGAVKLGTILTMACGSVAGVTSKRYRAPHSRYSLNFKGQADEESNRADKLKKIPMILGCWERPVE